MTISLWGRVSLVFAILRIVGGFIGYLGGEMDGSVVIPHWVSIAHLTVFGATAVLLITCSRNDPRAVYLGSGFLLISSSFADPLLVAASELPLGRVATLLIDIQPDAFLAYFLWLFFRDFPRGPIPYRMHRYTDTFTRVSLITGAALFLVNAALVFEDELAGIPPALTIIGSLASKSGTLIFWIILFSLALPAQLFALWKLRFVRTPERRRVRLFVASLMIGGLPIMIEVILEALIPPFQNWMNIPSHRRLGGAFLYPLLLSIPVTTSYSVLVHHVLDVRLIIRKALQYALARYSILAATLAPLGFLAFFIVSHRDQTVVELLSGSRVLWLLGISATAALTLRVRGKVFNALDRKFFREQYDARRILSTLAYKCQAVTGIEQLTRFLREEIDRALHLEEISVLVRDPSQAYLLASERRIRPLSISSELATLVVGSREPLDVSLEGRPSVVGGLPSEERQWVADGALRLLVPIVGSHGSLIGLIALGDKKSELPFSGEDKMLLSTIAVSCAASIERSQTTGPATTDRTSPPSEDAPAAECQKCHTLKPHGTVRCDECGGSTGPSSVPFVFAETFRFEKRIGKTDMSVVYRAVDLNLGRTVAIKTLPAVSPELSMRLRREARAMAKVQHPHLALIFGAMTWHGTPMLVLEFLEGGTLADRIRSESLSVSQTSDLGIVLAMALEKIHGVGILHRDIKPSNIGFGSDGTPKLLDFGLARILHDSRAESRSPGADPLEQSTVSAEDPRSLTASGYLVGTPPYISPEAASYQTPDVRFDLWGLAITLYECITGTNPMRKRTVWDTLTCIQRGIVPDIRVFLPECPEPTVRFFQNALHKDPRKRPQSAKQLKSQLEELQASCPR